MKFFVSVAGRCGGWLFFLVLAFGAVTCCILRSLYSAVAVFCGRCILRSLLFRLKLLFVGDLGAGGGRQTFSGAARTLRLRLTKSTEW